MNNQEGSNATKEIILREARRLLKENGTITIKDITKAAYVNVVAVNYHFGTKEKLVHQIITDVLQEFRQEVVEMIINPAFLRLDLDTQLTTVIDRMFKYFNENSGILTYSLIEAVRSDTDTPKPMLDLFIFDPAFSTAAIDHIAHITKAEDRRVAFSKYMLIFAALITPLFIESVIGDKYWEARTDKPREFVIEAMGRCYLDEIKKILLPEKEC